MTDVMVNYFPQCGLAPTHSEHANMTNMHCIRSRLLAKAKAVLLAQGVDVVHSSQDSMMEIMW